MALKESYDALVTSVAELKANSSKALDEVAKDVQALKDQINAGSAVSAEQLDAVTADIKAVSDALKGVDPVPGN